MSIWSFIQNQVLGMKIELKQVEEIVAEAIINYLYDVVEKNTEKLLVNKGADSEKIYRMLCSNCDIAGLSDNQIFFVKNYTYKIERINEKVYDSNLESEIEVPQYYNFIISGDFYCEDLRKLTKVIMQSFLENSVFFFINNYLFNMFIFLNHFSHLNESDVYPFRECIKRN